MEISDEKLTELGITREEWNVLYNAWVVKSIYDEMALEEFSSIDFVTYTTAVKLIKQFLPDASLN